MKASEAVEELRRVGDYPTYMVRLEIAKIIERQQKVVDAARAMVNAQNGREIDFYAHYGEALKATEQALAELEGME